MSATGRDILLGIDVGGTFTDAVLVFQGQLLRAKVPTTTDQSAGVIQAARQVLARAGLEAEAVTYFAHGMTTATNALLERQGAATASISTEGFRDLMEIGRQNRPRLYDLCPQRPDPLVPRGSRLAAHERVSAGGEVESLRGAEIKRLVAELQSLRPEAVAVCLLFSFLDPSHEKALGEAIARELPGVHVSLSCEVLPQFREYERFSTTVVDAYLTPVTGRYLRKLGELTRAAGLPRPAIMQSSGGVLPLEVAARSAAPLLLSGPAAGVVGAVFAGERSGVDDLIAFDMGGTSTDVTLVQGGRAGTTSEREVDNQPVALPMVDVHTIGAGGGSIAWIDAGGALRVGPGSAGAQPGPACYGHGGEQPTVTDANLCLGYLGERLGGADGLRLRRDLAQVAVGRLAGELGMDLEAAALGIRRLANAEMVKALRVISIERGHDPRLFVLCAFGGAGPMHAADLAAELGIGEIMVPDSCGVLSALGMVVGDERRDWVRTVYRPEDWDSESLSAAFARLEAEKSRETEGALLVRLADLCYGGQSHELTVVISGDMDRGQVARLFEQEHEKAFGYHAEGEPVELVNIRLTALRKFKRPEIWSAPERQAEPVRRRVWFGGEWAEADVFYRSGIGSGEEGSAAWPGPVIIEDEEATTVIPPGWKASIDTAGNLWVKK